MSLVLRFTLSLLILAAPARLQAQSRPLQLDDLGMLKGVSEPQLSPDGRWIAYQVRTTDYDADVVTGEIVVRSLTGESLWTIVGGSSPRWSPDGRTLAYSGSGEGRSGLWLYDLASGGSRFLTEVHTTDHFLGHQARKNFEWSPDGRFIAFVGAEPPGPEPVSDVRVYKRILYKTRTSFSDDRLTHVWIVDVQSSRVRVLTPGTFDEHSISWSPDGGRIAFVSNHSEDPDANYSDDLWTVDVSSGEVTRVTDTEAAEFSPRWSPDGRYLAFLGWTRPLNTKDSPAEDTQLFLISPSGGGIRNLTGSLNRRVTNISWHPDGTHIYFTAGDRGSTYVYRVSHFSDELQQLTEGAAQTPSYSLDGAGERLAYTRTEVTRPPEVWLSGATGEEAERLTDLHGDLLDRIALQDAEDFWLVSFDGTPVQGWIMEPAGLQEGREYPLILWIHGGPHGMYGESFSNRFQVLTARGYGVLYLNPRGSRGYGQEFSDGSLLNWGGGDYRDLMAGLDHALERWAWIDADRLGVIGGSYGGFMTNWVITQTDRFKAAVSVAGLSNLISFYGTSLYQLLIESEFNGLPWDNYALLWQWSPLNHVANVTTPTVFIHGENDHDVPIAQAEEMFIALRKLGVEAELARYPGEGHGFRRPQHQLDYLRRALDWFDRHLR